jgi:SOS-response transcriptional repressor LexA
MPGSLGSIQLLPHHGDMTTFKRLVRRFDAYTLEVFNPRFARRSR